MTKKISKDIHVATFSATTLTFSESTTNFSFFNNVGITFYAAVQKIIFLKI
jgi:hypothetical protein